eukprot:s2413_g5.t2
MQEFVEFEPPAWAELLHAEVFLRETASAALLDSQAGFPFARVLINFSLESPLFRASLLRRLRLPLPRTLAITMHTAIPVATLPPARAPAFCWRGGAAFSSVLLLVRSPFPLLPRALSQPACCPCPLGLCTGTALIGTSMDVGFAANLGSFEFVPWPIDFNSMASGVQQHCDEDRQQVRAKAAEEVPAQRRSLDGPSVQQLEHGRGRQEASTKPAPASYLRRHRDGARKFRSETTAAPRPKFGRNAPSTTPRFERIRRELVISQLCSDSDGSADFTVPLSPTSTSSDATWVGCREWDAEILKHPMDTLHLSCSATRSVATGQFEEASLAPVHPSSLSLQSPPSDSVDELCKAIPDMPLESVTSWTEVCPEETSRIDAGCSLPEARAFCRMCLVQADRARAELAELTGQATEEEAETPADLVARISSAEEARSFALMCLQAIEDYKLQSEAWGAGLVESRPGLGFGGAEQAMTNAKEEPKPPASEAPLRKRPDYGGRKVVELEEKRTDTSTALTGKTSMEGVGEPALTSLTALSQQRQLKWKVRARRHGPALSWSRQVSEGSVEATNCDFLFERSISSP